ncbi:MAG: hypothetical protein QXL17_04870 [Candidatus Thermoplasmatota archaeon]
MSDDDIQKHIDDIIDASDKEIDRDELEKEFRKFLEYGVPADQTKQTLLKKFSGSLPSSTQERTLIVDVKPNVPSVHLLCRVVSINPKEITVKGEPRKIYYGIFGDESGTIPFTAWKDFNISKGDILDITNAYTKEWQGAAKVNLGDRTRVMKTDESKIPPISFEPREYKLKDLRNGVGSVIVVARVMSLNERTVTVDGKTKIVYSGILADDTAKTQFTAWHDFKLKEGMVVRITGAYVKIWRGIPQVTFDEKASVQKLEASVIKRDDITPQRLLLHELVERNGALDVEVHGVVIEIRQGSGFIFRCPECRRTTLENKCSLHGEVQPLADLRLKLTVDDGTGTISVLVGKELTEQLLSKSFSELKKQYAADANSRFLTDIEKMLFARTVHIKGNALGDDFGITLIPEEIKLFEYDMATESEKLLEELEELV